MIRHEERLLGRWTRRQISLLFFRWKFVVGALRHPPTCVPISRCLPTSRDAAFDSMQSGSESIICLTDEKASVMRPASCDACHQPRGAHVSLHPIAPRSITGWDEQALYGGDVKIM